MGGCAAGTASVRGTGSRAFPSALPWGTAQWGHNPEKHHTALPLSYDNAVGTAYPISDASSHLNGQVVRVAHDRIGIMSHPLLVEPEVAVDDWSVDKVADLVERHSPTRSSRSV